MYASSEIHNIHILCQLAAQPHHHLGGRIFSHSGRDHKPLPEEENIKLSGLHVSYLLAETMWMRLPLQIHVLVASI
jgi:hypothetical protein